MWFASKDQSFTALRKTIVRLKKVPDIPKRSVKKACPQKLKRQTVFCPEPSQIEPNNGVYPPKRERETGG